MGDLRQDWAEEIFLPHLKSAECPVHVSLVLFLPIFTHHPQLRWDLDTCSISLKILALYVSYTCAPELTGTTSQWWRTGERHWDPFCLISRPGIVHVGCPRWMLPWAVLWGTGPELAAVSLRDSPLLTSLSSGARYINSVSAPGTKGNSVSPETQNTEWESTMWRRSPFHATPGVLTGSATTQSSLSYPCGIFHGLNVCLYLSNNVLLAFPVSCPKSSREQGGEYINI